MHSHHSHSGDYVSHAVDSLDTVVDLAAAKGFEIFCLTEHMPRLEDKFLYPEEIDKDYTAQNLVTNFNAYLDHGRRLQTKFNGGQMKVLLGFEVEGLDLAHIEYAKEIRKSNPDINMTVGSIHYVNHVAIDFSRDLWVQARATTKENTTRALYREYFEIQYQTISQLHSEVVGHFDLIRLFDDPLEVDPTTGKQIKDISLEKDWPEVWALVVRNIKEVFAYGGLFEINSAAIRKGWTTPYPRKDIANAIIQYGGARFCLSDDSHGLKQVGLNFHKAWEYLRDVLKVDYLYFLDLEDGKTIVRHELVATLDKSHFWDQYQ